MELQEGSVDEEFVDFFRETIENESGISTHVIPNDLARKILTEKRMELMNTVREDEIESKRDLARKLDRNIKAVSTDLDILWKYGVINYREEGNRKIPELSADKIIVEPF
ncbi:MAG: transcriptional regulator [Candidatus Nanohaloarchaea archaeon]